VALTHQHSGAACRPFLPSETGSIPGNRTIRRVVSPMCRAPADCAKPSLSAKHCGANGRASTAAVKSIGTVGREVGSHRQKREIAMTPKNNVLAQLVGIVCLSIATGMFFIQGFENRLRSNPLFWTQVPVIVVFLVVIILYCRRILRTIP
jgi:hypothetical protein